MIKNVALCDVCGSELGMRKRQNLFGNEFFVIETYRTREIDTANILPHLCKACALNIDNEVLRFKLSIFKEKEDAE